MIDGNKKCNCQLAFELHNSHVCEKGSNTIIPLLSPLGGGAYFFQAILRGGAYLI